jgi:AcrR family transcriptional regulator
MCSDRYMVACCSDCYKIGMPRSKDIKSRLLHRMGQHVLTFGLNTASLRPLAQAAATSDRMLIYHFGSKDGLIGELLQHLAEELSDKLDHALPPGRARSTKRYIQDIVALVRRDPYTRYMRLWLDIVSAAGQGSAAHAAIGKGIVQGYLAWLEKRLPEDQADPEATLALLLTLIEGVVVLDAVGQGQIADQAISGAFS